jgi:prohibitin 2
MLPNDLNQIRKNAKYIGILLFVFFGFFSLNPFVNIPAGHVGVVFDKLQGGVQEQTISEGLHFRMPIFQSVIEIPTRTQKVVFGETQDIGSHASRHAMLSAASSDLQDVYIDAVVTYHLNKPAVAKIYQDVGIDYEIKKIVPKVTDQIKTYTAKYKVAEILTNREEIKNRVFDALKEDLADENIVLEDVNLVNFDFNPNFKAAIEQKQVEEQKAQKEEYVLQQIEISSQQKVKKAEAEKQAKILEGEGLAQYNQLIQQEISPEVLEYKSLENARSAIEKWNGSYPTTYFGGENAAVPLINLKP